jgi:hypothetical protein
MVCLPQLEEDTHSKSSNSNLTEHISFSCELLVNIFEALFSDLYHLTLEMKMTLEVSFFIFINVVKSYGVFTTSRGGSKQQKFKLKFKFD